jgi:hypothetical protein
MSYRIAILLLTVVAALALAACSGSDSGPADEPLDLDAATRDTWRTWASEANNLARSTDQLYGSSRLTIDLAREHLKAAQDLADEIRASDPPDDAVLVLADDLDDLVHGLEFGLEFAGNLGLTVINIEVSTIDDAILSLARDSQDLTERIAESAGG